MSTIWDKHYLKKMNHLETWLYGKASLEGATRKWFIEKAKAWPEGTIFLDAGCGGGVTAYQMFEQALLENIKYIGVDFSACMLDLARKKVVHRNVTWKREALERLTFVEKFDKILLRAVLAHVLDPKPIIYSVAKALKKNGSLSIVFWNNPVDGTSSINKIKGGFYDNGHSRHFLMTLLQKAGLQLDNEYKISEKSARDAFRIIWTCSKI